MADKGLCKANIGARGEPRECGEPVADGMLACCTKHRRVPIPTDTQGVYKRGSRYVIRYRVNGKPQWESLRTYDEARRAKKARDTDNDRGELQEDSRITLHEYLIGNPANGEPGWIDRYQGTGRRGYRQETRDEDRRLLTNFALRYFPADLRLLRVTPKTVSGFVAWLCDPAKQNGRELADSTVRNALKPLRAALATARREGLIRHNPATDVALPHRERIQEDEDLPRPFPDGVMEIVVSMIHPKHRPMYELLAATGVRRSELLALEIRHLHLTGDRPHVKIRQRVRRQRGNGLVIGPVKSRHARRDLPIPLDLADRLRSRTAGRGPGDLVFTSEVDTLLDPDNLAERVLAPACAEAGVEWAGFHTFRHTVASRLFAAGRNAKQVQHWLGHHSASFTLDTYVHLLGGDLDEPLAPQSAHEVHTYPTPLDDSHELLSLPESSD
jgi:integrase